MKVCYIFPNNASARFSAAKLLETGYDVVFYCPESTDVDIASNMIFELNIIGREQNEMREQQRDNIARMQDNECWGWQNSEARQS